MDRGAWWAIQSVGLQRVRHDLVIKQKQQQSAIHRRLDKEPKKTGEKLLLSNTNFPILRYYQGSCKWCSPLLQYTQSIALLDWQALSVLWEWIASVYTLCVYNAIKFPPKHYGPNDPIVWIVGLCDCKYNEFPFAWSIFPSRLWSISTYKHDLTLQAWSQY